MPTRPTVLIGVGAALVAAVVAVILLVVDPGNEDNGTSEMYAPDRQGNSDPKQPATTPVALPPKTQLDPVAAPAPEPLPAQKVKTVSGLIQDLKDPQTREAASDSLKRFGPAIIPHIMAEIRNGDFMQKGPSWQARAVVLMSEMGSGALPALAGGLQDTNTKVRLISVLTLATMGRQSAPAFGAIEAASNDQDSKVRLVARGILEKLKPKAAPPTGPAVREITPDGKERTRRLKGP